MIVQHLPEQPTGKLVGQVSLLSENTLFSRIRITSDLQHMYIVIRLEKKYIQPL